MPFQLQYGVRTINPVLLHEWAGPYSGIDEATALALANASIPSGVRIKGLEVILYIAGVTKKYWYENGIADADLVPMIIGGSLEVQDEGSTVDAATTIINFTGAGVTATNPSPGLVTVDIPGGGGNSCPNIVKIAAVSGSFFSSEQTYIGTILSHQMIVGTYPNGFNGGFYDKTANSNDSNGNVITIDQRVKTSAIPIPVDLNSGDILRIRGMVVRGNQLNPLLPLPTAYSFIYNVSKISCPTFSSGSDVSVTTVMQTATEPFQLNPNGSSANIYACFENSITLSSTLYRKNDFLLVAFITGAPDAPNPGLDGDTYYFNYTLDVEKSCTTTVTYPPILIRNCCEPLYTEISIGYGLAVGTTFSDTDGNCWTIEAEFPDGTPTTSDRIQHTDYPDCTTCIASHTCPENFTVVSCCALDPQTFSATLSNTGLNVGDSFVDNNGFCWSVNGTTATPSTYFITVDTVYDVDDCTSCINANTCPELVTLISCCSLGTGVSTLQLVGGGVNSGDTFVDQFGFCWRFGKAPDGQDELPFYPNLGFIHAVTITSYDDNECRYCTDPNPCPSSKLYYTIENCCSEAIEVVYLEPLYSVDNVIGIVSEQAGGCYKIISWSNTGTETLTTVEVLWVSTNQLGACRECLKNFGLVQPYDCSMETNYCYGNNQTCGVYWASYGLSMTLTGYDCQGNWVYKQQFDPSGFDPAFTCMAIVYSYTGFVNATNTLNRCCGQLPFVCCWRIYNPSNTESIDVVINEGGNYCFDGGIFGLQTISLGPGDQSQCLKCVVSSTGPWLSVPEDDRCPIF